MRRLFLYYLIAALKDPILATSPSKGSHYPFENQDLDKFNLLTINILNKYRVRFTKIVLIKLSIG